MFITLAVSNLLMACGFLSILPPHPLYTGVGKPVLVIPWIVMQELDNHKTRGNGRLADKARKAIRLLFSCFTSNHPRVRCQTMEEVGPEFSTGELYCSCPHCIHTYTTIQTQTEVHNIAINNNDDRILHCCLLYQLKTQG